MKRNQRNAGKSQRKSASSGNLEQDKIVRVPFHRATAIAVSGAAGTLTMSPGISLRTSNIADNYCLYRFAELKYRLHPASTRTAAFHSAAYYPGIIDTAPVTTQVNTENMHAAVLGLNQTVCTEWKHVDRQSLRGYFPWYKTVSGSLDPSEETQGNIYVVSVGTESVYIEYEGVIEFKSPSDPGVTPQLSEQSAVKREKTRLLKILSTSDAPTTGPSGAGKQPSG